MDTPLASYFVPQQMALHEHWRAQYRANRYLAGASISALVERTGDLSRNLFWVAPDGRLTVRSQTAAEQHWWILWTHYLEEMDLRGEEPLREGLFSGDWVKTFITAPEPPPGLTILRGRKLPASPYLARIGQRQHLLEAYAKGRFRIAPASSYADPSLNPAIGDDELSVTVIRPANPSFVGGGLGSQLRVQPRAELVRFARRRDNFFVLCLSRAYDPRLLADFEGNAVLLVTKPDVFARRLRSAVERAKPHLMPWFGAVEYYDPYRSNPDAARIPMLKHFRYAYQSEMRFAWTSGAETELWEPFFVTIGPMRDFAVFLQ